MQRECARADAVGIGVQERDRVLWTEHRQFDVGRAQRLAGWHDAAAQFRLALADQRQEELGKRAQIRLAQRADAACAGMKALAQHVANDDGESWRETRSAAGDADQAHEQRCANFVGGEEAADADRARHHGLPLES